MQGCQTAWLVLQCGLGLGMAEHRQAQAATRRVVQLLITLALSPNASSASLFSWISALVPSLLPAAAASFSLTIRLIVGFGMSSCASEAMMKVKDNRKRDQVEHSSERRIKEAQECR